MRTWWLAEMCALRLDAYRILVGIGLCAHSLQRALDPGFAVPAVSLGNCRSPWTDSACSWLTGLSAPAVRAGFFVEALVATLIVAGIAPRVAAAVLFVLSLASYRAILPDANLDDYASCAITLVLLLVPIGRSARVRIAGRRIVPRINPRISAASVSIFTLTLLCVYLVGGPFELSGAYGQSSRVVPNLFRLVAIALVVPSDVTRRLGIALQVALHAYLAFKTHLLLTNVVLGASALLFWGEAPNSAPRSRWSVDTGAAIELGFVAVTVLGVLWALAGPGAFPNPALTFGQSLGILPSHAASLP
jgi:hypothetical protein